MGRDRRREEVARALSREMRGEVRFDHVTRVLYSTDASIYEIEPVGVVFPHDGADVHAAVAACAREGVAVLARGGGTSLAGQATGHAVHLDLSRHCGRILEIDVEGRQARVQPGVVLDQLNARLAVHGLMFGPDVAPSNRATIGGMIGNNACGTRSVVHGRTVDHVRSLRVVLSDGQRVTLSTDPCAVPSRIIDEVNRIRVEEAHEIRERFPPIMRRVSGYNLDALLVDAPNLAHLVVGSEGTLGVVEEATIALVDRPRANGLLLVHCRDLDEALEANLVALTHHPSASELLERMLLEMARASSEYARHLWFLDEAPHEVIVVEMCGDTLAQVSGRLGALEAELRRRHLGFAWRAALDPARVRDVWKVRKAGLPLLMSRPGKRKPLAFVEDTAVSPERLPEFVRRFREIVAAHGTEASFYAHASVGCMHIRPLLDLREAGDVRAMREMSEAVFALVREFGGCMSGEHGDGLARSAYNERQFGARLYAAFRRLKAAFDPAGLMNPGKVVDAAPMTESLRYRGDYPAYLPETVLDFDSRGGLAHVVEQCNGSGVCRKVGEGTMCPSFMATADECDSPRGRANALRGVISGRLPPDFLESDEMRDLMDLCVGCKACRSECPSRVDVAALKFEVAARRHERHGAPLRARLFAQASTLGLLGTLAPGLSNALTREPAVRWLLERVVGIDRRRPLPRFAAKRFTREVREVCPETLLTADAVPVDVVETRGASAAGATTEPRVRRKAVLFPDTFVEYHAPEVGLAALRVMQATGIDVRVSGPACCGRPMISQGLARQAWEQARIVSETVNLLDRHGFDVVMCEPSCVTAIRDDYSLLLPGDTLGDLPDKVLLLEEWLLRLHQAGGLPPDMFAPMPARVLVHGHCQQKALNAFEATLSALRLVPGLEIATVDSGCCGLAGAFGYETEHYELSMAMGQRALLPAVRAFVDDRDPRPRYVVATGTSCRQQIAHGAGVRALHPAQILARALRPPK
ncbi:MAG: FAD-binding oxidoreductase [Proteobacteria bacterium]|nr:FAD-binding oxidoreductase [Pseudomonadota bacterium]